MSNLQPERSDNKDMKIQDAFLNYCRRKKISVLIQLIDHTKKKGQIIGFDNQAIILDTDGSQNLIYKSAIIAINPQEAVNYIFNDAARTNTLKTYSEYAADFS